MDFNEAVARILAQGEQALAEMRAENTRIDQAFRDGAMTEHMKGILDDNTSPLDEETRRYLSRRAGGQYRPDQQGGSSSPETGQEDAGQSPGRERGTNG